ncbi:MAG: radical SAM family heme chaperone HemW [Flavobacteriales bacterium]|nr:radical SAM family heme chaperone HemW [Flavobacteriales bacterium]
MSFEKTDATHYNAQGFGVYFHVPFCRSKCVYCDFYSLSNIKNAQQTVRAMCDEISERAKAWTPQKVKTIYFGGGTPSILPTDEIALLLHTTRELFSLEKDAEITIEANPDDITEEKVCQWKTLGINRVSVGVQSFSDEVLKKIGRRHSGQTAINAMNILRDAGFDNTTLDIIYGIPTRSDELLRSDIKKALECGVKHISAYALTVEQGTALDVMIRKGSFENVDEEDATRQYTIICQELKNAGFEHYEVSNFAKKGYRSRHNSAYWSGVPYLGIGASAHSYDCKKRRWNVSSVEKYISGVNEKTTYWQEELLSAKDRHNELVMTSLRTAEGISLERVRVYFGGVYAKRIVSIAQKYMENQYIKVENDRVFVTEKGVFLSDMIESDMFLTEDI